jgi:hypothetical protein
MIGKLIPGERAVLFQYVLEKGLPDWATKNETKVLAMICQKSESWAEHAYAEAARYGWVGKRD